MNSTIPRAPLILGLAGLIPFIWGAATVLRPDLGLWTAQTISPRFAGPYVMLFYGAVILSFMSGVLWGFATRIEGRPAATGYALSVLPALWAFLMTGGGPTRAGISLMAGFIGLLGLDWLFWALRRGTGLVDASATIANIRCVGLPRHWSVPMTSDLETLRVYGDMAAEYAAVTTSAEKDPALAVLSRRCPRARMCWIWDAGPARRLPIWPRWGSASMPPTRLRPWSRWPVSIRVFTPGNPRSTI